MWTAARLPATAKTLAAKGLEEPLATLLALRGIASLDAAEEFLAPRLDAVALCESLPGCAQAARSIAGIAARGGRIAIVGDYDVDGITATALITAAAEAAGARVTSILPHRQHDGYGFQAQHVEVALAQGCELLVTVDCGSTALLPARAALEGGLGLIVVDHHQVREDLPPSALHLNPQLHGEGHPLRDLSAAGLAMLVATAVLRASGLEPPTRRLAAVAALGTVADMVPLNGPNRALASAGLAALADTRSHGLRALYRTARVEPPITAEDVGFRLGPRLNAAGRMDHAGSALELLLCRDAEGADRLAQRLEDLNRERRSAQERVVEEAFSRVAEAPEPPPLLVAWDAKWHPGVVGIAAGRLARRYHRPAILLAVKGDNATGSGRSVAAVDLHGFLRPWRDRLSRFGGHQQAIGLSAPAEQLPDLAAEWVAAAEKWDPAWLTQEYVYELSPRVRDLSVEYLLTLQRLAPFGAGNPAPLLRISKLRSTSLRPFGRNHLEVISRGEGGERLKLVGWGWGDRRSAFTDNFEALGHLERDDWSGGVQVRLVDARPSTS